MNERQPLPLEVSAFAPPPPVPDPLHMGEERFRALVENSWDGITLIAADGTTLYSSPGASRSLGYAPEELVGSSAFNLSHPEEMASNRQRFAEVIATPGARATVEFRLQHRDGSWRWLEAVATNLLHDPAVRAVIFNHRDVTERKLAEAALRESEERLRLAIEAAQIGTWDRDLRSDKVTWNETMGQIYGVTPRDFGGSAEAFLQYVHPDDRDRLRTVVLDALRDGTTWRLEYRALRPDGAVRWVQASGRILRDEQGRPVRMLGVTQDLTERRHLEEQLLQAQKMEAVGRLAGGIAHDFNNLLTGILGYNDLVLGELPADHVAAEAAREIQKATERAALMTSQLLAFSRKQVLAPQVIDLNGILADMTPLLRRLIGEDVELMTLLQPDLGSVCADAGQLQQVIVNLAVNARDAMPTGGTLLLQSAAVANGEPTGLPAGRYACLTVSDTGCGMTPEVHAHLFEPFFTTKEVGKGTGLGLSTSYGIVRQSGGAIEVSTEPGHGSTFRIYLRRVEAPTPASTVAAPPAAPRGSETVMVVEDEDVVRALLLRVLRQQGYTVLPAGHGRDALLTEERHEGRIDLLVTDVVMPGLSGRQVAEEMTRRRPGLRVLYVSGYTNDAMVRHGVREAETAFLQKPFAPEALARKVREVLDS